MRGSLTSTVRLSYPVSLCMYRQFLNSNHFHLHSAISTNLKRTKNIPIALRFKFQYEPMSAASQSLHLTFFGWQGGRERSVSCSVSILALASVFTLQSSAGAFCLGRVMAGHAGDQQQEVFSQQYRHDKLTPESPFCLLFPSALCFFILASRGSETLGVSCFLRILPQIMGGQCSDQATHQTGGRLDAGASPLRHRSGQRVGWSRAGS